MYRENKAPLYLLSFLWQVYSNEFAWKLAHSPVIGANVPLSFFCKKRHLSLSLLISPFSYKKNIAMKLISRKICKIEKNRDEFFARPSAIWQSVHPIPKDFSLQQTRISLFIKSAEPNNRERRLSLTKCPWVYQSNEFSGIPISLSGVPKTGLWQTRQLVNVERETPVDRGDLDLRTERRDAFLQLWAPSS